MRKRILLGLGPALKSFQAGIFLLTAASIGVGTVVWGAEQGFETPPTLKAGEVLPANLIQGKRYRIEEAVPTDGFLMKFTIVSDFGTFVARSPEMAETRIKEIDAIDRLEQVSKSDAFMAGLKASGRQFGQQVGQLIDQPVETIKGIPEGVGHPIMSLSRGNISF